MSGEIALVSDFARRITAQWHRSREAVLEIGRILIEAKAALPHGAFGAMIRSDLPFGERYAQKLMAVAGDERLSNANNCSHLPASADALFALTKLSDEAFGEMITVGTIAPTMAAAVVNTVVKKQQRAVREADLGAKQAALPDRRFGVILADPEWRFEPWSRETGLDRSPDNHYPTSALEVIAARDVPSIAAPDCVLFLWATAPMLPHALVVMGAWGFDYKSHVVWTKDRRGTGYWFINQHEILLVGTRGSIPAPAPGTQWTSAIVAPRAAHSAKPEIFLELIEQYFPTLPKIELNRRGPAREGWSAWGNESGAIGPAQNEEPFDPAIEIPRFITIPGSQLGHQSDLH